MSPAAFYEFSRVRIIVVPAVTDQSGQLVCTTTSIYNPCTATVDGGGTQFSGINAYAESYFDESSNGQPSNSTTAASANLSDFSLQDVAEIHFSTPFVYLPPDKANEELSPMPAVEVQTAQGTITLVIEEAEPTISNSKSNDNSDQDYGYVPQTLIDWMAKNPRYVSQYPYLASCYPGGPSIKPDGLQGRDGEYSLLPMAPIYASVASDLTTSTQVTVSSAGCFHPEACPTPAPAATPNPVVPANTALFVVSEEASVFPTASEQFQSQKATIANSPMRAPGLGGIIASALGGSPFALSPNLPSSTTAPGLGGIIASALRGPPFALSPNIPSTAPAPPLTPSPNAPSPILPAPHVPKPSVPSQNALAPNVAGSLIITVGSQSITLGSASNFVIAGQTLHPGAPDITFQGTPVSLGLSASVIVVAGSTVTLPTAVSSPAITVGFQSITLNSASHYVVAGKTLTPGAPPINIQGTPASPNPTAFSIAGTTILAGDPGATLLGTLVSLGPSGSLVIGTSTTVLSNAASSSIFTVGGQMFTANPTAFSVAGTKISAGGPGITISGTAVSLGQSGSLIIGTSIAELSPTAFTVGNQVFTPNPTAFPFAQTTISAGGPGVTIAGGFVSLGPSGSLVIGNSTVQLSPTSTGALGFTGQASCRSTGLRYEFLGLMFTCAMILTS